MAGKNTVSDALKNKVTIVEQYNAQKTDKAKSEKENAAVLDAVLDIFDEVTEGERAVLSTTARELRKEKRAIEEIGEVSFTVTNNSTKPIQFVTNMRAYNARIKKFEVDLGNLLMEIQAFEKLYKTSADVDLRELIAESK